MRRLRFSKCGGVLMLTLAGVLAAGCAAPAARSGEATQSPVDGARRQGMNISQQPFGTTAEGKAVDLYTLDNGRGMKVSVMTYGCILTAVETPDRTGKPANVTLNLDTLKDYLAGHPMFGAVVGRVANRIGGAKFTLDGVEYPLAANSGKNCIHGGKRGFDKAVWKAEPVSGGGFVGLKLSHTSPDGDEGFPGKVDVTVTYTLTSANELKMEYAARADKPTVVNLTNHAYWNLAGAGVGDVLGHRLMIPSGEYLPADDTLIPTGEYKSVEGTPLDFRKVETVGARVAQIPAIGGYDHCYVLAKTPVHELALAARVSEPTSGRVMEVWTTYPGVQLYTANKLKLKAGDKTYGPHSGLCLETQYFPDSPNKPQFPSAVLRPGEVYHHLTVHKFSVEK
jgi:aldose 1-epimerase